MAPVESPPTAEDEPAPSASVSGTPEVEVPPATPAQWASRIAESARETRQALADWEADDCLPTDVHEFPGCQIRLEIMRTRAQIVALGIQAGLNAEAPGFIGEPPDEIRTLVEDTLEAALAAEASGAKATEACRAGECTSAAAEALFDFDDLVALLDAWVPYGVPQ